jgi:large subunit ribosomal protein L7/L12
VIRDIGPRKIEVIKAVRQLTQLGLSESKKLTETKDAVVLDGVDRSASNRAFDLLKLAGAEVELV